MKIATERETASRRSVTLLEMPPGFPEIILLDENGILIIGEPQLKTA